MKCLLQLKSFAEKFQNSVDNVHFFRKSYFDITFTCLVFYALVQKYFNEI